jgi:hypothetical protein
VIFQRMLEQKPHECLHNHPKYAVMIQYEWWLLDMILMLNGDIYGIHAILVVGAHGSLA